jgi:hypothetical protein
MSTIVLTLLALMAGAGLWLFGRNAPIFTLGDPIQPDEMDELDDATLQAYAAKIQAAAGEQSIAALVRQRLVFSFTGLAMLLGAIVGTLWLVLG